MKLATVTVHKLLPV